MTTYVARWNGALPGKEWLRHGRVAFPVGGDPGDPGPGPAPAAPSLHAGHIPNRVLVGMSTPSDTSQYRPGYTEAIGIVGGSVYAHREFINGSPSANPNWLANTLAWNRTRSLLPVCTFKIADWEGVANGAYDASDWDLVRAVAESSRTSGPGGTPQPFLVGFNHEPDGDGDLTWWGRAQTRMSNDMAGRATNPDWTPGAYTASRDLSDVMGWAAIFNGHWMGPKNVSQVKIDQALPPFLTTAFRANRSLLLGDFYDPNPSNKDVVTDPNRETPPYTYAANADRTSKKIQAFVDWARSRNCGAIGCGEFSATEAAEVTRCWQVMRANRDIWTFTSYFNSAANSRWNWRLIEANYPAYNPDVYKAGVLTLRDYGGGSESAAKLAAFRTMRTESASAAWTGPIGTGSGA